MKGDIVHVKDFEFTDGSRGNKYAVVLNSANKSDPILVVKTTSQSARYGGAMEGCNPNMRVFLLRGGVWKGLPQDTYIQLRDIFRFDPKEFEQDKLKRRIEKQDHLSDQMFSALKNCLKLFKEDI